MEKKYESEVLMEHRCGSVNVFDTQLLHRRVYESGSIERMLLTFEFSVSEKHQFAYCPIGTSDTNSFLFSSNLHKNERFSVWLDSRRESVIESHVYYCKGVFD